MEDQEELILVGNNGEIPAGLPGNIMRKSMENKNLLKKKGSMYVGTGNVDSEGVVITTTLEKGPINTVLLVNNENELEYNKISPDFFDLNAGTYPITCTTALTHENVFVSNTSAYSTGAIYYEDNDKQKISILEKFDEIEEKFSETETLISAIKKGFGLDS